MVPVLPDTLEPCPGVGPLRSVSECVDHWETFTADPPPAWLLRAFGVRCNELARRCRRPDDGVVIAVERGTPLAEVLRAQAVDVREAGKGLLLESAGKREIAMLIPVVLVLPITLLFVLFPRFYGSSFVST